MGDNLDEVADCIRLEADAEDHPEGGEDDLGVVADRADVSEADGRDGLEGPVKSGDVVAKASRVHLVFFRNPCRAIEIL